MNITVLSPEVTTESAQASGARSWQFAAFDSWFFRESRPFDSIGGAQLSSHFPPPARTLAGAVRTSIGEFCGVNWHLYNQGQGDYNGLRAQLGNARSFGTFQINGPYLLSNGERLYPAPLLLLEKESEIVRLVPGEDEVNCDLGRVRLPKLSRSLPGASPLENCWLTRDGMEAVLSGGVPTEAQVKRADTLWNSEDRVGIGRNNSQRANIDGLLYQTCHIRPHPTVSVEVEVRGVSDEFQPQDGVLRLGGEGRFSSFVVSKNVAPSLAIAPLASNQLIMVLLTSANFTDQNGNADWKPCGFQQKGGVWSGVINGVSLRIVSAILGKAVREGGWDMANNCPRPLQSLIPAGSCYFCKVDGELSDAVAKLHQQKIGQETELGRGEIAIGAWV